MGFGHRVYRTYDPRARALGEIAEGLAAENERLALARHVEEVALRLLDEYKPGRRLYTNVEYYAAVVLGGVDLPPDLYPATFAAARTAGWTAHILEQLQHNRLIRPTVDYVGPDARVLRPAVRGRRLGQRLGELLDARLGGLEPAAAGAIESLAALPQRECLLQRRGAVLEPLHDLLQLVAGRLERQLLDRYGLIHPL